MKAETVKKNKFKMTLTKKRAVVGIMFISPWLIGFLAFYIRCFVMTIQFSLSDVILKDSGGYKTVFAGISNYVYAFREHASFSQTLVTSLGDMVVDVPLIIFFSLFMAMILNKKFTGRTLVRAIFFLPVIMNSGAILDCIEYAKAAVASGSMTNASAEVASAASGSSMSMSYFLSIFEDIGLPSTLVEYVTGAVSRIQDIISLSGVQIVIFIAALQSVPSSMYEVAKIEGATAYETFWKVTFPMVMPLIITNIVYTVVDSFTNSEIVDLAYNTAFGADKNYGLSSAMSLISTVAVCFILIVVCGLIQKRTFYYN